MENPQKKWMIQGYTRFQETYAHLLRQVAPGIDEAPQGVWPWRKTITPIIIHW